MDIKRDLTGNKRLLTQTELASWLGRTTRYVRSLTDRKIIPAIKVPGCAPLYDTERVLAALNRFEVAEVGRR